MSEDSPVRVEVQLLPPLCNTAGRERVDLVPSRPDLGGVLEALLEEFDSPEFRLHLYDTEGRLIPAWCAFINGRPVRLTQKGGLHEPVKSGDKISLILNLAGG